MLARHLVGIKAFSRSRMKLEARTRTRRRTGTLEPPDDDGKKNNKSKSTASSPVRKLNSLLNAPTMIKGEDIGILLSTKCGAYRQVEIKEYMGQVCVIVHTSSYFHEAIANHFYNKIADRLNKLHASYHVVSTLRRVDDHELETNLVVPLGVSAIGDDARSSEWNI